MAEKMDVNEMFQKMGERLGWFKDVPLKEPKQSVSHGDKKAKIKKETEDLGAGNPNGKKTRKLKLKKKTKSNLASDQHVKSDMSAKYNTLQSKARSFKVLLSSDSDSDSDFQNKPQQCKGGSKKAVLQLCSDSDDDLPHPVSNEVNSNACVRESFLGSETGTDLPEFEPILNIQAKRNSDVYWNDTVVKNRVSLASCTLDLDNLGEPLVESTRVHRRSSITYKHIIEDSSDEPDAVCAGDTKEVNKQRQQRLGEQSIALTSLLEDTKYVTAIEAIDDTMNSSDSNLQINTSMDFKSSEGKICQVRKTEDLENTNSEKETHGLNKINICENQSRLDSSDLTEEVEVIDAATQTEDCEADNLKKDKKVNRVYKENTVVDNSSETTEFGKLRRNCNEVYNEDTVEYSPERVKPSIQRRQVDDSDHSEVSENSSVQYCATEEIDDLETKFASTTIQTTVNEYSKQTVDYETGSILRGDVYLEETGSGTNNSAFEQETAMNNSDDLHVENNSTFENKINTKLRIKPKYIKNKIEDTGYNEIESDHTSDVSKSVSDEESLCEVCDAGTQTEEIDKGLEENGFTDNVENKSEQSDTNERTKLIEDEQSESLSADVSTGKETEPYNVHHDYDESQSTEEEVSPSNDISTESSDSISESFAKIAKKLDTGKHKKTKIDVSEQSWRSDRKYSSDSSSEGDLEAFFQKLKKPEKKKSESSSPVSMNDFIVEDDDMTSESEDSGFYLRETREMETRKEPQIVEVLGSDEDSSDFSSKIYPPSVTKHKKRRQAKMRKQKSLASWSFSSDSEGESEPEISKPVRKLITSSKTNGNSSSKIKHTSALSSERIGGVMELSTDSEDEVFNVNTFKNKTLSDRKNGKNTSTSVSDNGIHSTLKDKNSSSVLNDEPCLFKTPNPIRKKKTIADDDKENEFRTPVSTSKVAKTPKSSSKPVYISLSDTDSDEDSSGFTMSVSDSSSNSRINDTPKSLGKLSTPRSVKNTSTPRTASVTPTCTFLKSLSNTVEDSRRHAEARRFVNSFVRYRGELSTHLFKLYNRTIFENKLPESMPVVWNKRLLRTAGYCAYKKNAKDDKDRSTRIELSVKVCDNAERVRDTLIHEMCHAAVWLLNGVNGGHGPFWKYWAKHATRIHPELPAVSVCHSYSINTKFTYRCKTCGYSIGRHSKSLDVKKKVCGYCRGEFELIRNSVPTTPTSATSTSSSSTPRPPNKFALFVKDNYNSVKRRNESLKHGDVMKELSKLFAESKISS